MPHLTHNAADSPILLSNRVMIKQHGNQQINVSRIYKKDNDSDKSLVIG
ncbi:MULTISPECIES: hypothetical protein [unclassified Psychrobacter]|nr:MULTISPECIES: hypothetical protein [unclassified Psychrobacter]MDN3452419.1 hypothetical protein [Psychrobacter sp. APC 3350]MDN3502426.1 hypothetical protein [Psychrobacter sp. 5A.1]